MHWGVVLPVECSADEALALGRQAQVSGVETVWLADTVGERDPFVLGCQLLASTEQVRVGVIFTNPVSRPWAILASSLLTLAEHFPGRLVCGIGRADALARARGVAQPAMCSAEEFETAVHLLASTLQDRAGGGGVAGTVDFRWAGASTIPILVVGLAPRVVGIAARRSSGLIYQFADPVRVRFARRFLEKAVYSEQRTGPLLLVVNVPAVVGNNVAELADALDWFVQMAAGHALDLASERLPGEDVDDPLATYVAERPPALGAPTETVESRRLRRACAEQMCLLGPIERQLERIRELESEGATDLAMMLVPGHERSTLDAYAHAGVLGRDPGPRG